MARVRTGLDVLLEQRMDLVRGRRIGLVANHSAVNRNLIHILDALLSLDVKVAALFGPEHGVRGEVPAGREVPSGVDSRTDIPIHSLYGLVKKPTPEMLNGLDAVIFDVQDIGSRFYTFISTMSYVMQACAQNNVPFIVLDRPNPIGGQAFAGNIPEKEYASFVGLHAIPIRHGMTMGELAQFINERFNYFADLEVVMCTGWKRSMYFEETELPWVMPSPNMPTPETALVYPGTCFLEGTNISEGRGTTRPFEILGTPWIDAYSLAETLTRLRLPGVGFRPTHFVPTASKYAQQLCHGVQIHVFDRKIFEPVRVGLCIVKVLHTMYPELFQYVNAGSSGRLFFDLLAGTDKIRVALDGDMSVDDLINTWFYDLRDFLELRKPYLRYI